MTFDSLPSAVGENLSQIVGAALGAADPYQAVKHFLYVDDRVVHAGNLELEKKKIGKIYILSFGKASIRMAQAADEIFSGWIEKGIVITKHLPDISLLSESFQIFQGGHPIPSESSVLATQEIIKLAKRVAENDLVVCLVSGGASALLTMPREGISLADLQTLVCLLLSCGASIDEINIIRKHLDLVKGGGLAKLFHPARIISLVLSDVVGNPMDIIASGPTVPDPSTYQDVWKIFEKYNLEGHLSAAIKEIIHSGIKGLIPETPKAGDPIFRKTHDLLIADNRLSALAAMEMAKKEGFHTLFLSSYFQGEAREIGQNLGGIIREMDLSGHPICRPAFIIAGGESTVTIRGKGLGGRNLEVALGSVRRIAGLEKVAFLSFATDGEDGPTDAAGALVTGETYLNSLGHGLDITEFLEKNDSYHFFEKAGGLVRCGPTGTNVNDLYFLMAY